MAEIKLCEESKCTGCGACANICPTKSISMIQNKYGELISYINKETCIKCGLCMKSCHKLNQVNMLEPNKCYAAVRKNKENIARCSSGGIATLLMEYAVKNNWKVFSTRYDDEMKPKIIEVDSLNDIEYYKGSKYVQSETGNAFSLIKKELNSKEKVLFIGTPCQIAGLKMFLKKEYENLYCCDLFCHGVTPNSYFEDELKYLNFKDISNVSFRGWNVREDHWFIIWKNEKKVFAEPGTINYYAKGFYENVTLRESCYNCNYSNRKRVGDLSFGDFLGLSKELSKTLKNNCVTAILVNNDKGKELLNTISKDIELVERPYEEAIKGGISLRQHASKPKERKVFLDNYVELGFSEAIRKTLKNNVKKAKIKRYINYIKKRLHLNKNN